MTIGQLNGHKWNREESEDGVYDAYFFKFDIDDYVEECQMNFRLVVYYV